LELSVDLGYFKKVRKGEAERGFSKALDICRRAGFRYLDYTPGYRADDWRKTAEAEMAEMDALGMTVWQSHAPFNRYGSHGTWEDFLPLFHRSFEAAAVAGARYIVVHADEFRVQDRYDLQEITDFTYEYLAPEIEFAKKHGMKVAIENLFEEGHGNYVDGKSRFTSRIEEVISVIEKFADPDVCCCFDFGHASCSYGYDRMPDILRQVGKYVECTHVHDNRYCVDSHHLPFRGDIPWESVMQVLSEIGFDKKFSFELGGGVLPASMVEDFAVDTYITGQYLLSMIQK